MTGNETIPYRLTLEALNVLKSKLENESDNYSNLMLLNTLRINEINNEIKRLLKLNPELQAEKRDATGKKVIKDGYEINWTWREKVIFVLYKAKQNIPVNRIFNLICEYEPIMRKNSRTTISRISSVLIGLEKKGAVSKIKFPVEGKVELRYAITVTAK
jgi:hypothetical protein